MAGSAVNFRLVTANLQHCAPGIGRRGHPRQLVEVAGAELAELAPDVLALSEVDYLQPRSGWVDQARQLAAACGLPYVRFAASYSGPVVGPRLPAINPDRPIFGGYGIALASRWPVRAWRTVRLRYSGIGWWRGKPIVGRFHLETWLKNRVRIIQPRVALMAEIALGGAAGGRGEHGRERRVRMMAAHLTADSRPEARAELVRCAAELTGGAGGAAGARGAGYECVLTGDLNQDADDLALAGIGQAGLRELGQIDTFPAHDPVIQLDHVLGSAGIELARPQQTVRLTISDHQVLISDLTFVTAESAAARGGQP